MKFVMSYSCGKDSTLALHRMIEQGHEPVALITMFNEESNRSFFHGVDYKMIQAYSEALRIPVLITSTKGANYHLAMVESLKKAVDMGAEVACFGDIDIEGNRKWAEERSREADLKAVFPLWHKDGEENVYEFIELGYKSIIKSINNTLLPKSLLGKFIDSCAINKMKKCGIDICGENGEYHTLVVDGPIFHEALKYQAGELMDFGDFSIVDLQFK